MPTVFFVIRLVFFLFVFFFFLTNAKNLDLSYKMDLDLWGCLGRVKFIAKFHGTDLVICSRSREGTIPSYSRINTVVELIAERGWVSVLVYNIIRQMYFFRPVLSKVKDKSVISLPGWVAMAIPVIEETPISQMSQVGNGIS